MCFPGKRLKNNHAEDAKPAPKSTPASSAPAPATQTAAAANMSSPKVAIIIYSMYGHVASCMSHLLLFTLPSYGN